MSELKVRVRRAVATDAGRLPAAVNALSGESYSNRRGACIEA
jgi:hypothetical protein